MPGGDGTGPVGMGPMTGRAMGYCAGAATPDQMNVFPRYGRRRGGGWGRGRRWGGGNGWGRGFNMPPTPNQMPQSDLDEMRTLELQAERLEGMLGEIKQRIAELQAVQAQKS